MGIEDKLADMIESGLWLRRISSSQLAREILALEVEGWIIVPVHCAACNVAMMPRPATLQDILDGKADRG